MTFIDAKANEIHALEKERQGIYNRLKTAKMPELEVELKIKAKGVTGLIKHLRKELKTAENALKRSEYLAGLLETERAMEVEQLNHELHHRKERDKGWER